jgi:hypothetical protein
VLAAQNKGQGNEAFGEGIHDALSKESGGDRKIKSKPGAVTRKTTNSYFYNPNKYHK